MDTQHRRLVDIINYLGGAMIDGKLDPAAIEANYQELAAYARRRFADEEELMVAAGLSAHYIEQHRSLHLTFVEQLGTLWRQRMLTRESSRIAAWIPRLMAELLSPR